MCYSIYNEREAQGFPEPRRERTMFEAMVKVNGIGHVEFFERVAEAIRWIREFYGNAREWYIYDGDGNLYPYHC